MWTTRDASALDTRLAARPYFDFANTGVLRNTVIIYRVMTRRLREAKCKGRVERSQISISPRSKDYPDPVVMLTITKI